MAFKDITKVLYDGKIKLDYKDKAHRYYARPRLNWDLPDTDPKAWGKIMYPKGTTTLLGDTLEKKGLMLWPMGMALRELFGFYDFTNENGDRMTGFSKDVGSMWGIRPGDADYKEQILPLLVSASKAWSRKKQKGADIGSVVHNAIERFITANPNLPVPKLDKDNEPILDEKGQPILEIPKNISSSFDIGEQYMWNIKEAYPEPEKGQEDKFEAERTKALEDFKDDVDQATLAFKQFENWWLKTQPKLLGSEDIVYSMEHNICGTYDAFLELDGKRIMCDFKTSNASTSKEACMPEGISYDYFVQSAIYALLLQEMHQEKYPKQGGTMTEYDPEYSVDDILIVSARKDGGFSTIFASDLGLTMKELTDWALSVIQAYRMREKTRAGLVAHAS